MTYEWTHTFASRTSCLTGTGGAAAARVAIGRAQRQLAVEGKMHLHVRNFAVRWPVEPRLSVLQACS